MDACQGYPDRNGPTCPPHPQLDQRLLWRTETVRAQPQPAPANEQPADHSPSANPPDGPFWDDGSLTPPPSFISLRPPAVCSAAPGFAALPAFAATPLGPCSALPAAGALLWCRSAPGRRG